MCLVEKKWKREGKGILWMDVWRRENEGEREKMRVKER